MQLRRLAHTANQHTIATHFATAMAQLHMGQHPLPPGGEPKP